MKLLNELDSLLHPEIPEKAPQIIDEHFVKALYQSLNIKTPVADTALCGSYRQCSLPAVSGHKYPLPEDIPQLMAHFSSQIEFSKSTLHPVELAAMAYKRIVDIAPFPSGNEALAQALMDQILTDHGYPALIIPDEMRAACEAALKQSRKHRDMDLFSQFIIQCLLQKFQ